MRRLPDAALSTYAVHDSLQPMTILEIRGLNTYYGESHILRGIDISVDSGEPAGLGRFEPKAIARMFFSLGIEKDISRSARLGQSDCLGKSHGFKRITRY